MARDLKKFVGTFDRVQTGDYTHLSLTGARQNKTFFICEDLPASSVKGLDCFELEKNPANYKGKTLTVIYYVKRSFIKEANKSITWNYVERIDLKEK